MATNIWNIEEFKGDGVSCPITPVNLPWYKKAGLFFFRFGICPLCVTSSVGYGLVRAVRTRLGHPDNPLLVGSPDTPAA